VRLVLAILDNITDRDPQSWFDAWTAMAADLPARPAGASIAAEGGRLTLS